jgi:hypothetical protein
MSDAFSRFGPFLLVLLFGAGALILAYRQSKKRTSTDGQSRSLLDYLLLWPLLFERSSVDRSRRLLTNREVAGWLIVVLLIVVGLVFF